jgi:hypothetical protein
MTQLTDQSLFEDVLCRYFKKPGFQNTAAVMEIVSRRAAALGVKKILVATNSGQTAREALDVLGQDFKITAVTHVTGFKEPNHQELSDEARRELEAKGITVLTCQHAFGGVGRGVRNKLSTYQVEEIIAFAFRTAGQGVKVAVELALMAADAGLVRTDENVISIGGTGRGADTALLLQPANSFRLFDIKIKEVICKPVVF